MKNIRVFLSENLHILVAKFSVYLNRHVFVMISFKSSPYCKEAKYFIFYIFIANNFHVMHVTPNRASTSILVLLCFICFQGQHS